MNRRAALATVALVLGCTDLLGLTPPTTDCQRDAQPDAPPMCGCGSPACGTANALTTTCAAGVCVPECIQGFDTCAGDTFAGCTTDVRADSENCGRCGHACGPGLCVGGFCQPVPVVTVDPYLIGALALDADKTLWVLGYSPDDRVTSSAGEIVSVDSTQEVRVVERVADAGEPLPVRLVADGTDVYAVGATLTLNTIDIGGGIIISYYSLPYATTLFGLTGSDGGAWRCFGDAGAGYNQQDPVSAGATAIAVDDASVYVAPPEGPIAVFERTSGGGCSGAKSHLGPASSPSNAVQYNGVVAIEGGVAYALSSAAPSCIGLSNQPDASLTHAYDCTAIASADGCLYWVEYGTILHAAAISPNATCIVPASGIASGTGALKAIAVGGGVLYVSRTDGTNGGALDIYRGGSTSPVQSVGLGGGPIIVDVNGGLVYFAQRSMVYKLALP